MSENHLWELIDRHGTRRGTYAARVTAMNAAARLYLPGRVQVRHAGTRELWERRAGSWMKIHAGDKFHAARTASR